MIVTGQFISASQPGPVDISFVTEHDDVAMVEINFDRPKRPWIASSETDREDGSIEIDVHLLPSDDTPPNHRDDQIHLNFLVTGAKHLLVLHDSWRYSAYIVFADRGAAR